MESDPNSPFFTPHALPGQPQHVTQRGNNRSAFFAHRADYARFRRDLLTACDRHGCTIHAYVFMTNHVHLLITPNSAAGIGRVMQSVGSRYVHYFNRRYERTGALWEGRYRAVAIDTDRYLFACYRYIERNPVRAGMVKDPEDYPWSSYRANALGAIRRATGGGWALGSEGFRRDVSRLAGRRADPLPRGRRRNGV